MGIAKKFYIGAASLLVAAGALVTLLSVTGGSAEALTMGDRRDCGYTDVIIDCGAITSAELLQKYDSNNDGRGNRDIQAIFNHFGIQRSDITGSTSEVKKGWMNTNGVISVDGKTVATGAKSLYRVDPDKEVSPITIAGKTYYIGPVANNYRLGADVFVFFKNGTFHAAIQASCGNPIVATPTPPAPKPVYKCENLTATKLDRTRFRFNSVASASNGAEIVNYTYNFGDGTSQTGANTIEHTYARPGTYTISVTVNVRVDGKVIQVTGPECKTTIKVEEVPVKPSYKCESVTPTKLSRTRFRFVTNASASNGAEIVNYTYDFGDGNKTTGGATVEHDYAEAGNYTIKVTVNVRVDGKIIHVNDARCQTTIKVEEEPVKPVYKCESLDYTKIARTQFRFTTDASASNGATIVSYTYDFGDGSKSTTPQATVTHNYAKPGNYTIRVTVNVSVDGKTVQVNDSKCKTTIKVEEEPVKPVYKCESLTARPIQNKERTYAYTLSYLADGGATLSRVTYNFGDNTSETFTPANATSVEHQFATAGTFTTTATLYFNVPEGNTTAERSANCEVKITVPEAPCPTNPNLPKDSPDCGPCPYNPELPKDSPECVEAPTELPKTGMDLFIGGSLGVGSVAAASYYWIGSRRNLLDTLLNK